MADTRTTIILVVMFALVASLAAGHWVAATRPVGRYAITSVQYQGASFSAWRIDTTTGDIHVCTASANKDLGLFGGCFGPLPRGVGQLDLAPIVPGK